MAAGADPNAAAKVYLLDPQLKQQEDEFYNNLYGANLAKEQKLQ